MNTDKTILTVCLLTLGLVVGLYLGAYLAWQKYQAEKAAITADPLGTLKGLLT